MNTHNIIIGVVIVIVIYLLYLWFFGDGGRTYLSGMRNAEQEHTIAGHNLPAGGSADYTYSIWLFIANWNYRIGEEKVVFERLDRSGNPAPTMALGKNLNNVEITLATYPSNGKSNSNGSGGGNGQVSTHTCILENIPLQAWANVILTLNNRALDLYLDGKLVRTCVLPGVPKMSAGTNVVTSPSPSGGQKSGGGFEGYISNFQYLSRAVNPREAYAIYREGPGGSNWLSNLFNKYRLKIAFMKDNKEVNSFEI